MVIAGGIDLGGTKIEAQLFDAGWHCVDKKRIPTPEDYDGLLDALIDQMNWLRQAQPDLPIGIAAAGLISAETGLAVTANLAADGKPFLTDLVERVGFDVTWQNDCRAFTLAEAKFGAGWGKGVVVGLLLGTGIAGGVAVDGRLLLDGNGLSGEYGHLPLPAVVVSRYELPLVRCGCGRTGCIETLTSGPGIVRLAKHLTGLDMDARGIAAARNDDAQAAQVWECWREIVASLLNIIVLSVGPDCIILGGGLSEIDGIHHELQDALSLHCWPGFPAPPILPAERGETAGALGAAFAAWKER